MTSDATKNVRSRSAYRHFHACGQAFKPTCTSSSQRRGAAAAVVGLSAATEAAAKAAHIVAAPIEMASCPVPRGRSKAADGRCVEATLVSADVGLAVLIHQDCHWGR
jgi:hypothetical protein